MVVKRSGARSRGRRKPAHRLDRYHRRRAHRLYRYGRRQASRRDRYRRRLASRRDRWRKGKNQPGWLVLFYTGCGPIKFVASAIWRGRLKNRGLGERVTLIRRSRAEKRGLDWGWHWVGSRHFRAHVVQSRARCCTRARVQVVYRIIPGGSPDR